MLDYVASTIDESAPVCSHCLGSGLQRDDLAIGQVMRRRRERRNLDQRTMASRMACVQSYVSMLERGLRGWSRAALERYERALTGTTTTLTS